MGFNSAFEGLMNELTIVTKIGPWREYVENWNKHVRKLIVRQVG
jgi:hypothetical protein